jgi:hypothetical protein
MKKSVLLLALIPLFLHIHCNKDDEVVPGFDMMYQQTFTIPAGIGIDAVHSFLIKNIPTNYQTYLTQSNKEDTDIKGISVSQVVLRGMYGDADYSFIEEAKLRIYKENDPNDFIEIAYRYPTPLNPGNLLPLIPNLPEIKRFMTGPRFNVDLRLRLRNITQFETDTRLELQFRALY